MTWRKLDNAVMALVLLPGWLAMSCILIFISAFVMDMPFRETCSICKEMTRRLLITIVTGEFPS